MSNYLKNNKDYSSQYFISLFIKHGQLYRFCKDLATIKKKHAKKICIRNEYMPIKFDHKKYDEKNCLK